MQTKTIYKKNYKKTLFRGNDGLWHIKECTCWNRRYCIDYWDYEECEQKPSDMGPFVAFAISLALLLTLIYSFLYLESLFPY